MLVESYRANMHAAAGTRYCTIMAVMYRLLDMTWHDMT